MQRLDAGCDPGDVVAVGRPHTQLQQRATARDLERDLFAAVTRREHTASALGETELAEERRGLVDRGDTQADGGEAVERHA